MYEKKEYRKRKGGTGVVTHRERPISEKKED
jgi:hypothetical protein